MAKKAKTFSSLPSEFKVYFWDVDWDLLNKNIGEYESFIVERLADKGDLKVVVWLKQFYDVRQIAEIIQRSRRVSLMTRLFWTDYARHLRASHSTE